MTQSQLAEGIQYSSALVAKIELADRRPSPEFARRCDKLLGTNGLLERIQRKISRDTFVAWLREWVAIEQEAVALRGFQPLFIPGLLQTEAYARAVLSGSGRLVADELEQQVAARIDRQDILARDEPPLLTVAIDASVLHRPVGGPAVMREQLEHLVKVGTSLPRLRIHIVPPAAGAYAGLNGPSPWPPPPPARTWSMWKGRSTGRPTTARRT